MKCPKCQFDNPDKAKFCNECGAKIELACPKCRAINPSGSKFCNQCGQKLQATEQVSTVDYSQPQSYTPQFLAEKILTTRSSIEGERKQVTVLFCDISNSTSLAEQMGAEGFHGVVNQFFDLCLAEVHRYEGTINQFLGDGFMALFGAPIACEDHGRRSVMAAVRIQKKIKENFLGHGHQNGVQLELRIGMNTGPVVVGAIGDNLRMDYTAVGDTTNIAARLQQMAEPGQILISGSTRHTVRGYCSTRKRGEFSHKGKTEKVPTWEVTKAREALTRFEAEAQRGLTHFVGRLDELGTLHECFALAREGRGQIISLVGEAGIGKSRLLLEFRRQLDPKDAKWLEGHALSFGKSMAFYPLIDMMKRNFHIEENDPEDKIVQKIDQGVLQIGNDLRTILPFLRYLITRDAGDPIVQNMAPQLRRSEILRSLRYLLIRAAEVRPQILLFEDLHWFDQATEDALVFLANSIHNSRVLVVCTYRPGYANPIGDRAFHARIMLPTLSPKDSLKMTRLMLATDRLPKPLKRLIIKKAEGNPLFVEEIVRSLRESGTIRQAEGQYELTQSMEEVIVPTSIQDVLMARIDRLDDDLKKILQIAAVIGREFTYQLLNHLADTPESTEDDLRELENAELVQSQQIFPELVYTFKHALTQEVAYWSLLKQHRKNLHQKIGGAIEDLYKDRAAEFYEVLAYHFARGERWRKALEYFIMAGKKATQAFAIRDALAIYDHALDVSDRLEDTLEAATTLGIYQARSELCHALSDYKGARGEGRRLLKVAYKVGNIKMEGVAMAIIAGTGVFLHKFDEALSDAEKVIDIGRDLGEKPLMARGHIIKGHAYIVTGRIFHGRPEIDKAIKISESVGDVVTRANALRITGLGKNWEGKYSEGGDDLAECIRLAKSHNMLALVIQACFAYGIILTANGDYQKAQAIFFEGLELAEKVGEEAYKFRILNGLGWLYGECGDLSNSIDYNSQSAEFARKRVDPEIIANAELNIADIFLIQEDFSQARKYLENVFRITENPTTSEWMKWRYRIHLFASFAEYWLAIGNYTKAEEFARQCIELAQQTASLKYLVKGFRVMGEVNLSLGDVVESQGWLNQAVSSAQAIGNPTQLYKAYHTMGRLHEKARNTELTQTAYQSALQVVNNVRSELQETELKTSFEHLPLVEQVIDANSRI